MTNLSQRDVNKIIKGFPLVPTFNGIIITLNMDVEEDGLTLSNDGLSETQYIIAKGEGVRFPVGQKVLIDLKKLIVNTPVGTDQHQDSSKIEIDPITVDDTVYALVNDRYIKALDNR